MFSFFQKKVYLADYLHGMVDIHNHILPGIDDGSKSVAESLGLLRGFSELGVKKFICTPHIMHNHYDNTPKTIKDSYDILSQELEASKDLELILEYAAEHMVDDNFEHILAKGKVIPLHNEYLLIEMSYLQPSLNFDVAVEKIGKKGLFPVLAHPERYMYFHHKYGKYPVMKSQGVLYQANLLSLTPESYGEGVAKITAKLLEDDLIDFVGSDVHNMRQLSALKEIKLSNKLLNRLLPIIERTIHTFY